eukprot:scaffold13406_cov63-Phaeocystis_antarctica.AAC.3
MKCLPLAHTPFQPDLWAEDGTSVRPSACTASLISPSLMLWVVDATAVADAAAATVAADPPGPKKRAT